MCHKLVYLTEDEQKEHKAKWPEGYNDAPAGWRRITEEYLARNTQWGRYTPDRIDYKQITRVNGEETGECISCHLFYFWDGTGVACEMDYWGYKHEWVGKGKNKKYVRTPTEHVRWYAFGCEHEYVEFERPRPPFSGIHKERCKKCGNVWVYDTSD